MSDLKLPEINHVSISGRLTRDPELRYTPSGMAVCEFGIASNRRKKGADGEWGDVPSFHSVVAWDKAAEWVGEKLSKGRPVYVEGRLDTDQYEKDGQKRSKTRITAHRVQELDWPGGDDNQKPQGRPQQAAQAAPGTQGGYKPSQPDEDDLPF